MKHVVIDLEMNPVSKKYKEERLICNNEIIQIGAVILDDKYNEIGNFMTLVRPEYNSVIERKIEKLTGITTEMVSSAPIFKNAIQMFFDWCSSISDEISIYEWSDSDRIQVEREMELKHFELNEYGRRRLEQWQDFQNEFGLKLGLENSVSLKNALMYAGINFEGRQHDALFDARNTAVLLHTVRDPELRKKALDTVIEVLHPTPEKTMGDMFDFSKLVLSA